MTLPTPDNGQIFECPYCGLEYDLWLLIGRKEIIDNPTIFHCKQWDDKHNRIGGCRKRFILDLKLFYVLKITKLKNEENREQCTRD
jgi:hypothetical protein